jgi:membrane fusion protein (multidrug efflux system)
MPVEVERAEPQRVPIVIETVGQAHGSREVEVRARVSGILEKRLYDEGSPVAAGAVLFRIDPAPYELAVRQARAALMQEQARVEQARRESNRLKGLAEQRAISQKEYSDAASAAELAAASLAGAEAKVAEAQLNLSYTVVRAPIGGITGSAARSEGSLVNAGTESSLLTTIIQVDPIWVQFSLAESDFERVRGAQKRAVVKLVNPDGSVAADNGRLNFTATTVDSRLGTVALRAEFGNRGTRWLPGQFVRAHVYAAEQQAYLVPQSAVVQTEQSRMVWLVGPDGKATMRPVQTANWIGSRWVITGGLKPGEQIIVDNLMKLRPGAPVQPRGANGAADSGGTASPGKAPPSPPGR